MLAALGPPGALEEEAGEVDEQEGVFEIGLKERLVIRRLLEDVLRKTS